MGRKAVEKVRLQDEQKVQQWAVKLWPKFVAQPNLKMTSDDLASFLGISKATMYKYITSVSELINIGLLRKMKSIAEFEKVLKEEDKAFTERYMQALEILVQQSQEISNEMLTSLQRSYPDSFSMIEAYLEEVIGKLKDFYEDGIQKGNISTFSPEFLAMSDELFLNAIRHPEYLDRYNLSLSSALQQYFEMKIFGILA